MEDSDCVKELPSERTKLSTGFTAFVNPVFVFEAILHKFAQTCGINKSITSMELWNRFVKIKNKWQKK